MKNSQLFNISIYIINILFIEKKPFNLKKNFDFFFLMEPNQSDNKIMDMEVSIKSPKKEFPDYNNKLKSLNNVQLYTKGSYIDVYDNPESVWRVAKILDATSNYVKINFDGWKSVYDEVISKKK